MEDVLFANLLSNIFRNHPKPTVLYVRNHPKPTVLYVPQYVANFVSKKSCSI